MPEAFRRPPRRTQQQQQVADQNIPWLQGGGTPEATRIPWIPGEFTSEGWTSSSGLDIPTYSTDQGPKGARAGMWGESPDQYATRNPFDKMTDPSPGTGEKPPLTQATQSQQNWDQLQGQLATPGFGEQGTQRLFNQGFDQSGMGNVAQQYSQQYQQQIGQDPGLDMYYDRARERTSADMNQQLASRGAYGSSAGLGMLGDALGGLSAQQAKEEADYMLNQQALGGQLAGQAAQSMLGWSQGLGQLGLGGDAAMRGRQSLGITASGQADQSTLNQRSQAFDEIYGLTKLGTDKIGGAQQAALAADMQAFESWAAAKYGASSEAYNKVMQERVRQNEAVSNTVGLVGTIAGMGGGGGGGQGGGGGGMF